LTPGGWVFKLGPVGGTKVVTRSGGLGIVVCGIAGRLERDPTARVAPETIRWTTDVLRHRGPDAEGYFRPEAVRRSLDEHAQGRGQHHDRLLELWHRAFMDSPAA
jgi:hypothetical protein